MSLIKPLLLQKGDLDTKFEEFEERITDKFDSKLSQLKSDIFDRLDKMAGVQSKDEEEDSAHEFSHQRINDDLSEISSRVARLEKASS